MKQLSLLILANTVLIAGYCLLATSVESKRVLAFASIAAFVGLGLLIGDRLTGVKVTGVGELTAATERAVAGAANVEKIEKEVEQHRDSIAMIVRDANKAQDDIKRIEDYAKTAKKQSEDASDAAKRAADAQKSLSKISEFNVMVTRATNDDRKAFDQLREIAGDQNNPFQGMARQVTIRAATIDTLRMGTPMELWKTQFGFDPSKAQLTDYPLWVYGERRDLAADALGVLWTEERFTKHDRLEFLNRVILETDSLMVLSTACRLVNIEAKLNRNILAWEEYTDWWKSHSGEYK